MSGDVYERNRVLIQKVYQLGVNVFSKNEPIAERLMKSTIPLLRYNKHNMGLLSKLSKREIEALTCTRQEESGLVYRVLQGESINLISKEIPALPKKTPVMKIEAAPPDVSSGLFENVVRALEDGNN
ncbi:MAG: hypothetical protein QXF14_00630 [Candidatus Woesearchaeota archaeon]